MHTTRRSMRAGRTTQRWQLFSGIVAIVTLACGSNQKKERSDSARGAPATDDLAACVADPRRFEPVAFQQVDLGLVAREAAEQKRILTGPRTQVVIADSSHWASAWREAVDTVPPPAVEFGPDALILVATKTYGFGPTTLSIESIRRCKANGAVVVGSRQRWPHGGGEDFGSRGLTVVRVAKADIANAAVTFVDLPEIR